MGILKIHSIDRVIQWSQKQGEYLLSNSKHVGKKITSFVLECIRGDFSKKEGIRKPTQVKVLDPSKAVLKTSNLLDQNKKFRADLSRSLGIPIGIKPCVECGWINSWIQFLIYFPRFIEIFSLSVKTFHPFHLFIDQYLQDQKEGRELSLASSSSIFDAFQQVLSLDISEVDFGELTSQFFRIAFPFSGGKSSSLIFHPEWIVNCDTKIQESLNYLFKLNPLEILIGSKRRISPSLFQDRRQLFPKKGGILYDLYSFIEARPNGLEITYIAYIKIGRVWYQCDNERIRVVSSPIMDVPLERGVVFHYKKVIL